MKPKTKAVLKVLACYWIASVCMVAILGGFGEGHPDVAFSNSIVVMVLIAPLVPFITVFSFAFAIFDPMALAGVLGALLAFALPFLTALSIAFKRPARWYLFLRKD